MNEDMEEQLRDQFSSDSKQEKRKKASKKRLTLFSNKRGRSMLDEIEMLQNQGALSEDNNLNEKDVITSSKKIMKALKD